MTAFEVFRNADFRNYRIGSAASLVGSKMQAVVIAWLAWQLTQSGGWVGTIGFAEIIPVAVVAPRAGILLKRLGPKGTIALSQLAGIGHSVVLVALLTQGLLGPVSLLALAIIIGVVDGLFLPSDMSFTGELAEPELLSSAIAVRSALSNLCVFVGPMLAGVTMGLFGPAFTCLVSAASRLYFVFVLIRIAPRQEDHEARSQQQDAVHDMPDGWRFFRVNRGALVMLFGAATVSLTGRAIIPVLSEFIGGILHDGSTTFAWSVACMGLGATVGGLILGRRAEQIGFFRMLRLGLVGTAGCLVALTTVRDPVGVYATLFILGMTLGVNSVCTQTYIQLSSQGRRRGKALGIYVSALQGGMAIGSLCIGGTIPMFGIVAVLVSSAVICILALFLSMLADNRALDRALPKIRAT